MIDEKLREIILGCEMFPGEAIKKIKALVVESLGEDKEIRIPMGCLSSKEASSKRWETGYSRGYNQHIAEMKEKWNVK